MKLFIFGFCLAATVCSCKQKDKVTIEKFTDTRVKDTIIKPSYADSIQADSLRKVFQAAANDTIVPGKSIGNIRLNETTAEVMAAMGNPDSSNSPAGTIMRWFSAPTGKGTDTSMNSITLYAPGKSTAKGEEGKVKSIRVTSPYYKTAEKVSCGSTLTFIKMHYPSLKNSTLAFKDKTGSQVLIYDAVNDGITFEINEATKCAGITIHEPGKKASETYMSIYGEIVKMKKNR